ncbi:MAG: hypothetical protein ACD_44C00133G0003 [uncultured bacterium]|nr:MAG: hypothetical protein ACD_44C00133G0003 [uncultured bacterium]
MQRNNLEVVEGISDHVIEKLNGHIDRLVDKYKAKEPRAQVRFATVLKHLANPDFSKETQLNEQERADFMELLQIIHDPNNLKEEGESSNFNSDEIQQIRQIILCQFNQIANQITEQQQPEKKEEIEGLQSLRDQKQEEEAAANKWWSALDKEKQEQFQQKAARLNRRKSAELSGSSFNLNPPLITFYYYDMFLVNAAVQGIVDLTKVAAHVVAHVAASTANAIGHGFPGGGGSGSHHGDKDKEAIAIIVGIIAAVATAISATVSAMYALKKTFNSLKNFFTGNKMLRSAYRLAGIGSAAYGGSYAGAIIGTMIFPGVGTVIGAVVGAMLAVGVGALVTKYTAKVVSYVVHGDTNPEKWTLTAKQTKNLEDKGYDIEVVNQVMQKIRQAKNEIGIWGSWPWSIEREHKDKLNELLNKLKNGTYDAIYFGKQKIELKQQQQQDQSSTTLMYSRLEAAPSAKNHSNPSAPPAEEENAFQQDNTEGHNNSDWCQPLLTPGGAYDDSTAPSAPSL